MPPQKSPLGVFDHLFTTQVSQRTACSYGLIVVEKGQFEWKFGGGIGRHARQAQPGPPVNSHRLHGTPRTSEPCPSNLLLGSSPGSKVASTLSHLQDLG
jgi:hypothetical protein